VTRPHLCKQARHTHGPWPVQKRFGSIHVWRGRSMPGCRIVGSHTRCPRTKFDGGLTRLHEADDDAVN